MMVSRVLILTSATTPAHVASGVSITKDHSGVNVLKATN